MPSALFNSKTGVINSTITSLTNPEQIAALLASGIGVLEVADNVNGGNSIVDLSTNPPSIIAIVATPPIPHIIMQFIAASINNGSVPASAFHPATLADLNTSMGAASLSTVDILTTAKVP